jgi:ubiquinone/menaquinone biosynthesis C-methylase UbiE
MGFYSSVIFPRMCDLVLGQPFVARYRKGLLAQASGDVLEVGFGTGLNLPHYPPQVRRLTAVDPEPGMHRLARRRLRRARFPVELRVGGSERLPFADAAFDCVASTWTLCSIDGVERALGEVYRVLRPSGRFLFLEHGLCPEPGVQAWQRRLNRLEMLLAGGCRLDRDIKALVGAQPFRSVAVDEFYLEHAPKTHGYLYRGVATK